MSFFERVSLFWSDYRFLVVTLLLVGWIFIARYFTHHLREFLPRFTSRLSREMEDAISHVAPAPLALGLVLLGIWLVVEISGLTTPFVEAIRKAAILGMLGLLGYLIIRIVDEVMFMGGTKHPEMKRISPAFGILVKAITGTIFFLIALETIGITTLPLVGLLGVTGLIAQFSFREALANFSAGVALHLDGELRPGLKCRLENGEEGIIQEMGWQGTKIRSAQGELLRVPNSKIIMATLILEEKVSQATF